jgi:lysine-specific histone demethylase 1
MQFPEVFWDSEVDYFGITQPPGEDTRGRCFMFWNLARFNDGAPLLAALVSGPSARAAEGADTEELQQHMLQVRSRLPRHEQAYVTPVSGSTCAAPPATCQQPDHGGF